MTADLVRQIVAGDRGAPNLIDGAVLAGEVGGIRAYFEADAVAARFGRPIQASEIKSFPTVDGQADPAKVGAALAQVSIYIMLLRELVARLGGRDDLVSTEALLITPRNTGLQPTMTVKPVGREIDRAGRILRAVPRASDLAGSLPEGLPSFAAVADGRKAEAQRIDAALCLADRVGTRYLPSCLSSCGLSRHWATELSALEQQSLPALDAAIAPPAGQTGSAGAAVAETVEIGPMPSGEDDEALAPLVEAFNAARARRTDEAVVAPLRRPIEAHYARLLDRGWPLAWRCLERERRWPEAPGVARRWEEDRAALGWHLEFVVSRGGRYRTRDTGERAARTLRHWEEARRRVDAEEAIEDPLRLIPHLLAHTAVAGQVVAVDL